ncbi:hypothetical protein QBC43DRAFT_46800 [Cladorrhinum sp. PSN259]|nr:hypothetical protein QBC43DRAFT_46800 [Cladorrhinum sp. PSN259]
MALVQWCSEPPSLLPRRAPYHRALAVPSDAPMDFLALALSLLLGGKARFFSGGCNASVAPCTRPKPLPNTTGRSPVCSLGIENLTSASMLPQSLNPRIPANPDYRPSMTKEQRVCPSKLRAPAAFFTRHRPSHLAFTLCDVYVQSTPPLRWHQRLALFPAHKRGQYALGTAVLPGKLSTRTSISALLDSYRCQLSNCQHRIFR